MKTPSIKKTEAFLAGKDGELKDPFYFEDV